MTGRAALEDEALVVRQTDVGEADRLVQLLTRHAGTITARARGARSSRRRFSGVLTLGAHIRVRVVGRPQARTLEAAELLDPHLGIVGSTASLEQAGQLLALVRDLLPEDLPEPAVFDLVRASLARLAAHGPSPVEALAVRLRVLESLGFGLQLSACVVCGRSRPEGRSAAVDPARGGLVCRACGGGPLVLGPAALDLAAQLLEAPDVFDGPPLDAIATPEALDKLARVLAEAERGHGARRPPRVHGS